MDTLAKLFGSPARVKTLKLFIFNPGDVFETKDIIKKAKINSAQARKETSLLKSIGLIKKKSATKEIFNKRNKTTSRKRVQGYLLDEDFHYLKQLRSLLGSSDPENFKMIEKKLHNTGKIKLIVISGFFIQDLDSRVDLLVVGDNLKKGLVENAIKTIESEFGRELRYTIFETPEFNYRINIYDKLVRDILEYPHYKLVNKLGI